jgi:GDSL-like Lipase/Acylhydrolase family
MKSALPWIIAVAATIAFGASFSELQRMRGRFGEVTRSDAHNHPHYEVREFIIKAALSQVDEPIIVMGDSITEMARLPLTIDGRPVVNAGIGGATTEDFEMISQILMQRSKPALIVVALGTNDDSSSIRNNYASLLSKLKKFSPRLLAVGVTPQDGADLKNAQIKAAAEIEGVRFVDIPLPKGSTLSDRIHLNTAGYRIWTPALVAAISKQTS